MPRVQLAIRVVLGVLAAVYFFAMPIQPFILSAAGVAAVIGAFLLFHMAWWAWYRSRGMGWAGIRLAAWVDILAAFTGVLVDPFDVPPSGLLVMIAVLGNGMQHGLKIFLEQFLSILLISIPVFAVRQILFFRAVPYPLAFVILFIAIAIFYVYLLLKRIERMKKEAEMMAQQDPLTKLYNRNAFIRTANYLLSLHDRKQIPLVVMFADLDNFKEVNDKLGHAFGDEVLRFFARLTDEWLRKSDIVARYGGDEFVFMLADMDLAGAEEVALRLQREFLRWADERDVRVGVSFGVAAVPEGKADLNRLLKHVDAALYEAKSRKEDRRVVIAPPLE
ncbi:MAG: GGDEF domain-containing protein [Thermodesulfobacteriota bacterium]